MKELDKEKQKELDEKLKKLNELSLELIELSRKRDSVDEYIEKIDSLYTESKGQHNKNLLESKLLQRFYLENKDVSVEPNKRKQRGKYRLFKYTIERLKKIDKQIKEKQKQMDQEVFKDKSREECEYILKWLTEQQPVSISLLRRLIRYNKKHMLDIIRKNRLAVINLNGEALIIDPVVEDSETIIENYIKKNEQQIKQATCLTHGGDHLAGKYVFLEQIEQIPIGKQHGNLTLLLPNMKPSSNIGAVNKDEIANNFEFHKHILMPFFETVNNLNSKKIKKEEKIKTVMHAMSFGILPLAKCLKYVINNLQIDLDIVDFAYPATNMFGFLKYQTIDDVKAELNDLGQGSKARITYLNVKRPNDDKYSILHPKSSFEDLKNFFKDKKENGSDFWKSIDMLFRNEGKDENIEPEKTKFKTNEHLVNTKKEIEEKQETKESQDLENDKTKTSITETKKNEKEKDIMESQGFENKEIKTDIYKNNGLLSLNELKKIKETKDQNCCCCFF